MLYMIDCRCELSCSVGEGGGVKDRLVILYMVRLSLISPSCLPSPHFFPSPPLQEGGGRKGLPRSFLNRFTRVHVELLTRDDMLFIAGRIGWDGEEEGEG